VGEEFFGQYEKMHNIPEDLGFANLERKYLSLFKSKARKAKKLKKLNSIKKGLIKKIDSEFGLYSEKDIYNEYINYLKDKITKKEQELLKIFCMHQVGKEHFCKLKNIPCPYIIDDVDFKSFTDQFWGEYWYTKFKLREKPPYCKDFKKSKCLNKMLHQTFRDWSDWRFIPERGEWIGNVEEMGIDDLFQLLIKIDEYNKDGVKDGVAYIRILRGYTNEYEQVHRIMKYDKLFTRGRILKYYPKDKIAREMIGREGFLSLLKKYEMEYEKNNERRLEYERKHYYEAYLESKKREKDPNCQINSERYEEARKDKKWHEFWDVASRLSFRLRKLNEYIQEYFKDIKLEND